MTPQSTDQVFIEGGNVFGASGGKGKRQREAEGACVRGDLFFFSKKNDVAHVCCL